MAWNPDTYNQFKAERFAPFYDVLKLIDVKSGMEVVDLGCGTGELTRKLADALPNANVLGVDASAEMLNKAEAFSNKQAKFQLKTIQEQLSTDQKWDLVFSNAAIQWIDDHHALLPQIISKLKPNGQLAIQIPSQTDNALNKILFDLSTDEPYQTLFGQWNRISPVLKIDEYAQILFENGGTDINVFEKVYPIIVDEPIELFNFISGTALIPYLERLNEEAQGNFVKEFKSRIAAKFTGKPILYPFKRIIISAIFKAND